MKKILAFLLFIYLSISAYSQYVASDLPKTWRQSMMGGGFMECTIHEDGRITSTMCSRCFNCNGMGVCQVCMGNGSRFVAVWGGWTPCTHCAATGKCPGCSGKGYSVINTSTTYGTTIGVDERGNLYVEGSGSSYGGGGLSNRSYVEKIENVPCYGYDCEKYCEKCKKVTRRHVHLKVYR